MGMKVQRDSNNKIIRDSSSGKIQTLYSCDGVPCDDCTEGQTPLAIKATFSGIDISYFTENGWTLSFNPNSTFIVPYFGVPCNWVCVIPNAVHKNETYYEVSINIRNLAFGQMWVLMYNYLVSEMFISVGEVLMKCMEGNLINSMGSGQCITEEICSASDIPNLSADAWNSGVSYSITDEVLGSDDQVYVCISAHTSSATNRPITGENWATYWILKQGCS